MTRPTLTFIAGANGSGKTTLTRWNSELFQEIPLLDPDAIANTLRATVSALFPVAAASDANAEGCQPAQERRAQQNPGKHFAYHARLMQLLEETSQRPRDGAHDDNLEQQDLAIRHLVRPMERRNL